MLFYRNDSGASDMCVCVCVLVRICGSFNDPVLKIDGIMKGFIFLHHSVWYHFWCDHNML